MKLMRLLNVSIFVLSLAHLAGCANARQSDNNAGLSGPEKDGQDTLIYSSPANYQLSLDKSDEAKEVEIRSYKDMFDLFDELDYTPESWQAGIREVPRVYLPIIGERWGPTTSKEITVENKKRLFFRGLAPLILRANELIIMDRIRLEGIRAGFMKEGTLNDQDEKWMLKLVELYKVQIGEEGLSQDVLDELLKRVDIVPVSLALGQAAEESGWGTSRFAAQGNAVFGQWTWGKNAIKPEQQREELGNYGIAAFGTLQESVCSYMLNLNTHSAYASLRQKRAELREEGEKITGSVLAEQLTRYSERGEAYVEALKSLMDYNRLNPADDAYLTDAPPIYLVPVAE